MIVPEAYSHPAKMAYGLLSRIIEHGLERGWFKEGDLIADCFGGVGTTGMVCAYHGLRCVSVELEPKFVKLANETYAMHSRIWKAHGMPVPVIVQGDSRRFAEIVAGAAGCVTSPPFVQTQSGGGISAAMRGEGNYAVTLKSLPANAYQPSEIGDTPGQLGRMPAGSVDAAITSPPYASQELDYGDRPNRAEKVKDNPNFAGRTHWLKNDKTCIDYGQSPGQLASLPPGEIAGVVTSPPYEDQNDHERPMDSTRNKNGRHTISLPYGVSADNIGNDSGSTYWEAVALIYRQVHLALKPGGHIVVVVKMYVKAGKLVDLPGDTWRLLQHVGFEPVERIRAMLVSETQSTDLFEGKTVKVKARKSFFRRLAESKGSPAIDFEEVLVLKK
jgi:DNA modification methylase